MHQFTKYFLHLGFIGVMETNCFMSQKFRFLHEITRDLECCLSQIWWKHTNNEYQFGFQLVYQVDRQLQSKVAEKSKACAYVFLSVFII